MHTGNTVALQSICRIDNNIKLDFNNSHQTNSPISSYSTVEQSCAISSQLFAMEQWKGKVAVVTGASSGIGAVICKDLCQAGVIVVGLARRLDRLEALKNDIIEKRPSSQFFPVQCDITLEDEIKTAFEYVIAKLGGVDILVNNAGIVQQALVLEGDSLNQLKNVLDTNLIALVSCTKKAFKSMADRNAAGYIINISSIAGHVVPNMPTYMNVYPSSKHALTALNTVIRHELNFLKKNQIRVSNVSPGAVKTEVLGSGSEKLYENHPHLLPEDVSDVVLYLLASDPRVQVEDVIMNAAGA